MAVECATTYGRIAGRTVATPNGDVHAFLGVHYAAPPVGPLRFARPTAAEPWTGTLDATAFGPAPMQATSGPFVNLLPGLGVADLDERCLTLNVWRPAATSTAPRPLLVWVYGGAFTVGGSSEPTYDGARLAAEQDVVVASLNYRVGAFGFLDPRPLSGPSQDNGHGAAPNCGLWDLLAGFTWLRDNAETFGAAPDSITAFGESAGAGALLHLLSGRHQLPVQRAILTSPGVDFTLRPELAAVTTQRFVEAIGTADLDALRAMPAKHLVEAQVHASNALLFDIGTMPFHPVIDGEVLDLTPSEAFRHGRAAGVDLLIGSTTDEMALFPDPRADSLDRDGLTAWAHSMIANRLGREPEPSAAADLVAAYERAGLAGGALWSALQTDGLMRLPAERLAELQHGAGGRAFRYQLAWHPTQGDAAQAGAFHAMDLPFVFDAFDTTEWGAYLGIDEPGRAVARAMRTAFATFARTGTPGSPPQLDPWPPYDTDRRATTVLADGARPVDDFLATERSAWAGLWSEACRPCPVPI